MPRRPSRAHQVGGDDGLAVTGFKRVQCPQSEGDERGCDEEPQAHAPSCDQFGECAARGCLLVGLEMQRGRRRRGSGHRKAGRDVVLSVRRRGLQTPGANWCSFYRALVRSLERNRIAKLNSSGQLLRRAVEQVGGIVGQPGAAIRLRH